jgi:ABC-type uncharacterized transport system permease subunit
MVRFDERPVDGIMAAMSEIVLYGLTAFLYTALGLHFWRTRWTATAAQRAGLAAWERAAILMPLALHSVLLYGVLSGRPELRFGFGPALSATLWLAVLIYWFENLFYDLAGMQALVLPAAAVCALLPALFPGLALSTDAHSPEFRVHLALAMLASSLFTIAALHALLMTLVERRLHGAHGREALQGPLAGLPPLLTLERLLFQILGLGFALLTLTLFTGVIYSEEVFGQALRFNHKTLFAIFAWIIFGLLLAGRWRYGWRGRRALRWTMTGFIALLLAYVGSRFVLEVVLGRALAQPLY